MATSGTFQEIQVKNIVKHPTLLGERCKLLKINGLSTYAETEETLTHALKSINDNAIDICIGSSHCSGFYKGFINETTPFIDKDPIVLLGYRGKYIVMEGKHRVCMAIRLGIKTIKAIVREEKTGWFIPLPEIIVYGEHNFTYPATVKSGERMVFLWVQGKPFVSTGFEYLKALDSRMCTKEKQVLNGLSYNVSMNFRKVFLKKRLETNLTVTISPDCERAKIWLIERKNNKIRTVCRLGLWEERHSVYVNHFMNI